MDPVTAQINQLAACNVPGRIRYAMDIISGKVKGKASPKMDAHGELEELLAFIEQRDPDHKSHEHVTEPVVEVTYFGDKEPRVEVRGDKWMKIRVELIDGEEGVWLFMTHGDVRVYYTSVHHNSDTVSDYWYATERGVDRDESDAFDIRDLSDIPAKDIVKYAELFPNDFDRQRMAYAIDQGKVTEDGLSS